jgi:uncharacterized protein YwgA
MANYVLSPIFYSIFEHDFDKHSFEDRLEMQKAVYLLQDLGISVGEYNFMWYKHGPYSQTLQNDILSSSNMVANIRFSADANRTLLRLKEIIFDQNVEYSKSEWLECLGSLHYIKENLLPTNATNEELLNELVIRKPHLKNHKDNRRALEQLESLFG